MNWHGELPVVAVISECGCFIPLPHKQIFLPPPQRTNKSEIERGLGGIWGWEWELRRGGGGVKYR